MIINLFADGKLHYQGNESGLSRLVLFTREERERILKECHNDAGGAHQGICRTQDKIKNLYYWMTISADVENWVTIISIWLYITIKRSLLNALI
jgi:hypothetical protein